MFGGWDSQQQYNDLIQFDLVQKKWTEVPIDESIKAPVSFFIEKNSQF